MKDLIQRAVRVSKTKIVDFRESYAEWAAVYNKREAEEPQASSESDDELKGAISKDDEDEADQANSNKEGAPSSNSDVLKAPTGHQYVADAPPIELLEYFCDDIGE